MSRYFQSSLLAEYAPMFLVVLGILIVALFFADRTPAELASKQPLQDSVQAAEEDMSVEEFAAEIKENWKKDHFKVVAAQGDSAFSSFVLFTLEELCPFYEPDGRAYRECMHEFIADKKPLNTEAKIAEDENYCGDLATNYSIHIAGVDLYLSCLAFKLSRHTN